MANEYEGELEAELEEEFEDESGLEGEGWLGAIGNIASSLLAEGEGEEEGESEEEFEEELEDESGLEGEGWLGAIGNIASSLLGEGEGEEELEDESAFEFEDESESELSPIRKIYPDAMMEHLGQLASEAETEDEAAEHFLPLIGMAASKLLPVVAKAAGPLLRKALPKIARAVTKASPHLTKSIGRVAKTLHRNRKTRHLLKTVPAIARRTVGSIARQAAHGRTISPRTAVRTLAKQTRHVLAHPGHRRHALRRHNHLERRFHRMHRGGVRPHARYGRGWRYGRYPRGYRYGQAPGAVARGGVAPRAVARGGGAPGVVYRPAAGAPGAVIRPGRVVGGRCSCPVCPTCGTATVTAPPVQTVPTPAYCRCCGQVIR